MLLDFLKMTLAEITATIKVNHNELALLNTEFAKRVTKTTDGQSFLSDDKVESAEYYLQVVRDNRQVFPMDFSVEAFETAVIAFRLMVDTTSDNEDACIILKTPRNSASQDCNVFVVTVRKRIRELISNPIFKLILEKEPHPRKPRPKSSPPASTEQPAKQGAILKL